MAMQAVRKVLHTIASATGLVSFSTQLAEPLESCVCEVAPVQSGTGDPRPTNIRPITGWTGIKVYRNALPSGYKRLKDITFDGSFHYESSVYLIGSDVVTMTITPGATTGMNVFGCYSGTGADARNFSFFNYQSTTNNAYFRYGTVLLRPNFGTNSSRTVSFGAGGTSGFRTNATTPETSFTTTDPAWIGMLPNSTSSHFSGTITGSIDVGDRLKFIPCERSDGIIGYYDTLNSAFLEPVGTGTPTTSGYEGEVADVDWTDDAGTVYGGSLDVVTGVLTVTHKIVDLGSYSWSYYSTNDYFRTAAVSDVDTANRLYGYCSCYKFAAISGTSDNTICFASSTFRITCRDNSYNHNATNFKNGVKGQTLVYKLKTPVTYQLTPEEVSTLKGSNTIWHDGNSSISVGYYDKT